MIKIDAVGAIYKGSGWDEKGHSGIAHIFVSHDFSGIKSIQFQYLESGGHKTLSPRYGANNSRKFDVVKLQAPSEVITGVKGNFIPQRCVTKLTFTTNRGTYGPFGVGDENPDFEWKSGGDWKFGGFYGTCDFDMGLRSLGMYLSSP